MSKVASPLQLHARGRVRGSTSFVSPVRSFADPVNVVTTEYSRAISLEIREIAVEKSVGFRGRAAARRMAQISARTRASRHKNRSVLKKGASQLHAGRFSVDPGPDFGRRGRCRARSPTPRALRLVAPNPIFEGIASGGSIDRRPPSRSTSSDDLPPPRDRTVSDPRSFKTNVPRSFRRSSR